MTGVKPHLRGRPQRFDRLIGTGGIGTGMFFLLENDHTLGRNESRAAKLVPYKDYCKLHIIAHYVAVLMGAAKNGDFEVWPIGKVGADEPGRALVEEMKRAGMTTQCVQTIPGASTMLSVCFQYPDSTGGNITTSNSACEQVSPEDIQTAASRLRETGGRTIVLAAPEVPLLARIELLREGRSSGAFNAASLLASEIDSFQRSGGFELVDYLSVNIDEAAAIAGTAGESDDSTTVVEACVKALSTINDRMYVSVTDGPEGSYGYSEGTLERVPPLPVHAIGTGGAGDAFLAGTLAGLACGLPFRKGRNDTEFGETPLESALELGTLVASLSVTSPDTIHPSANAVSVLKHALDNRLVLSDSFRSIFP